VTLSVGLTDERVDVDEQPITSTKGWVFASRWRVVGIAYVALTAPLAAAYFASVRGETDYIAALVLVGTIYWWPGFVLAVVASARTDPADRRLWRVWAALFGSGVVLSIRADSIDANTLTMVHATAVPLAIVLCLTLSITNTVLLRKRSGGRAVAVDALDLVVAAVAVLVPVACLFGRTVVSSPNAWFAVAASVWALAAAYCTAAIVLMRRRLPPEQRTTADAAIVLGVVTVVNTVGQVIYGVHDFTLPAAPFVGLHALCEGLTALFFLWAARDRPLGLERFRWRDQVRGRPAVTLVVLASVPVTAAVVWLNRGDPWVIAIAVTAGLVLVVLTSVRGMVSARETARLYSRVEQADDERRDLLNEVILHADADRHRVAAHLHRQSAALYTAMASLTLMFERDDEGGPTGPGVAAERLKADLARQSDELRRLAVAVRPIGAAPGPHDSHPLLAPIKAYVDRLYGDARPPDVTVTVDPVVEMEWTTEAIALRIVQEAVINAWRHAKASAIDVHIGVVDGGLAIAVRDDGVGFDVDAVGTGGNGMAALRSMARLLEADVEYVSAPFEGTTVRVVASSGVTAPPGRRPRLRLVTDG
jgi:signal transduction histidine kinase